jgi:hypothetical protein
MRSDYEVGYRKPPKSGQFKKGKSGNSAGRPKGGRGLRTILTDVFYQPVPVKQGGKKKSMPMLEAILQAAAVKALQGDFKSASMLLKYAYMLVSHDDAPDQIAPPAAPHKQAEAVDCFERMLLQVERGEPIRISTGQEILFITDNTGIVTGK